MSAGIYFDYLRQHLIVFGCFFHVVVLAILQGLLQPLLWDECRSSVVVVKRKWVLGVGRQTQVIYDQVRVS